MIENTPWKVYNRAFLRLEVKGGSRVSVNDGTLGILGAVPFSVRSISPIGGSGNQMTQLLESDTVGVTIFCLPKQLDTMANTGFLQIQNATETVNAASSAVLAIFTVVLAVATWKYYIQAKRQASEISEQTEEMEKSRELELEPRLHAGLTPFHPPNFCIAFVNTGGGIARDVHAEYWIEAEPESKGEWGVQIHYPEDLYQIQLPLESIKTGGTAARIKSELEGKDDTFVVKWEYKNGRGEVIEDRQSFSIIDKLEERTGGEDGGAEFYSGGDFEPRF